MDEKYPQIRCNLCNEIIPNAIKGIAIQICDKCIKNNQKLGVIKDTTI